MEIKEYQNKFIKDLHNNGIEAHKRDLQITSYYTDCGNCNCVNKHYQIYLDRFNFLVLHSSSDDLDVFYSYSMINGKSN